MLAKKLHGLEDGSLAALKQTLDDMAASSPPVIGWIRAMVAAEMQRREGRAVSYPDVPTGLDDRQGNASAVFVLAVMFRGRPEFAAVLPLLLELYDRFAEVNRA